MKEQDFIDNVRNSKGKSGGWPENLNYKIAGDHIEVELIKGFTKKDFRRLDSWGLAFLSEAEHHLCRQIKSITFATKEDSFEDYKLDFEAFLRRVSYLKINNSFDIKVSVNGTPRKLYNQQSLFNRPDYEIIRDPKSTQKRGKNKPGRIEKDFQTFLFGGCPSQDEHTDENTNENLAVLGEDFFNLKKKGFKIQREFPTGAFDGQIAKGTRILPTEFVDIVTLNKHSELSVIELKLNDTQLEVISQILDYALFFSCYAKELIPYFNEYFAGERLGKKIICYVVNNRFHPHFDEIIKYYITKGRSYNFELKKVILGYTTDFV